ncbi:MAG: acyl-CoA dehydrogenase family protein [Acidobacteriota bacterium]
MNPADIFNIEEMLSDEEKLVRDVSREFVEKEVAPIIAKHFEDATFPDHLVPRLGELGYLGANLPQQYGGAGINNVAYGLVMVELEKGDSAIRSFVSVQGALVMYPIWQFGSEEQKKYWLPRLAAGRAIGCFGLTEPDYGSDPGGLTTRAVKDGSSYVLNGNKMWITNGTIADVAVVWAKLDDQIRGFLVEKGTPGFSAPLIKHKYSLRASVTSELVFEDCRIPQQNMLPEAHGLRAALMCLNQARYGIACGAVGAAVACYEAALSYAKTRKQFDKPIASFQLVQQKLSYMATEVAKAQLLCYRLGRLKDEGKATHVHVSMAKMNNVHHALEIARMARDMLGAAGITLEHSVIRHMLNLETLKTYEGTHDIHSLIIGAELTGIAAFG